MLMVSVKIAKSLSFMKIIQIKLSLTATFKVKKANKKTSAV